MNFLAWMPYRLIAVIDYLNLDLGEGKAKRCFERPWKIVTDFAKPFLLI